MARIRTAAFTLVELLMVMAIMAILAGFLLAAIGNAKAKAQAASCLNNLKQWGTATQLYAAAHGDRLPPDGATSGRSTKHGWYVDLPRTMGLPAYHEMPWRTNSQLNPEHSIWICPSNHRRSNGTNLFHYCLNKHVNGTGTGNQIRLGCITHPTATIWLFDNGGTGPVAAENNVHSNLHHHGAQFTFLDGHAAWFRNKEYWNFKTNKGLTNNPKLLWMP